MSIKTELDIFICKLNSLKMLKICRVCCESIQGVSTKNLFESKQTILLHQIELLTGEWLVNHQNVPSYICICCEQDLKVSVALRERCIKSQRKLQENICASPPWETLGEDKMREYLVDEFEYSVHNHRDGYYIGDEQDVDINEFEESPLIKDEIEVEVDSSDKISPESPLHISERKKKRKRIDWRGLSEEEINVHNQRDDQQDVDINEFEESPLITDEIELDVDKPDKINAESLLHISEQKKKRKRIDWRSLSEEQIKEMKRKLRRRDCICDQCGRHFNDPSNFKSHLIIHSGIKKYECEECDFKTYTAHLLKRHSVIHANAPPTFTCQYCDKKFIYNNYRLRHERTHFQERQFQCSYCIKTFFSKYKREEHESVHTRIRKYYCELCDQHFLRKTNLNSHYRSKAHKKNEQQKE